jgi:hypothetical protein
VPGIDDALADLSPGSAALGLLVAVLLGSALPDPVQRGAELAIGVVIVALAARLLIRWRQGCFHTQAHAHHGVVHAHPHVHEARHDVHRHGHNALGAA